MTPANQRAAIATRPASPPGPGLAFDLEVTPDTREIVALGGIREDSSASVAFPASIRRLDAALRELDALADGCRFVLGHNILAFDLPKLRASHPQLRLLGLPAIDTLRFSPLCFPLHPYHRLVKHYQDGGLVRDRRNDPLLDSQLACDLFRDEWPALGATDPRLLAIWH